MAIKIVKRRNFKAPLPDDFYILKTLTRVNNSEQLPCKQFPTPNDYYCEYFMIGKDSFFFSGHYSSRFLIKWHQKGKDYFWPVKYVVDYITIYEAKSKENQTTP